MIDFLWELFEFAVNLFESLLISYFICSFMNLNLKSRKGRIICISGGIAFCALVILMNRIMVYEGLWGIVYIAEFFIFELIFLKGSVLKKLFVAFLVNIISISVNACVTSIISSALIDDINQIYTEKSLWRFLTIIIVQILLVYIYELILKIAVKSEFTLKAKEWALILSVLSVSSVSIVFIHMTQIRMAAECVGSSKLLLASEVGIVVINIVCFYMISALSKSNQETTALRMYRQQQEYQLQYAETARKQYEEIRRIRHDVKQNFAVISALQKEGKYSEAIEYANKCTDNLSRLEVLIDVGNDFVNAILNAKISLAKEKNIEVICSASKNIADIEDVDLCSLLGNMLDNAIDACEKCDESNRLIEINISSDEYRLLITVSNTIASPVLEGGLKTTKSNPEMHGCGIKMIKSIAKKYNGKVDFYEENNLFECQVLVYKL